MEQQLREVLRQPDAVLFIGSGVSRWSGLPSWTELIEDLAIYLTSLGYDPTLVISEARRGDLLQAASYAFDKLTRPQIGAFVRRACQLGKAAPSELHQKLVTLGPRCFVTTNFDRLLEASLLLWQPDRYYRVVTNRNLTETAEIVGARATDFVFKPHGDVEDAESIILTREQYRTIAPGGDRQNVLETMRVLFASRPLVYVGFSLRDPDFFYVKDLLANTYKGGTRDHYALMPDVTEAEVDYWRRNYGIHLLSYQTGRATDGSRSHKALLLLLHRTAATPTLSTVVPPISEAPQTVLALARHAARLSRVTIPDPLIPLNVRATTNSRIRRSYSNRLLDEYDGTSIADLLDDGPNRLILTGGPGSGKTFAVRHSAARLADHLHRRCLAEEPALLDVVVPIVADFKLYNRNLWSLVENTLPAGLNLGELVASYRVKIYLDAFNEAPREHIESIDYQADLADFLARASTASVIFVSRTSDGLRELGMAEYNLAEVEHSFVAKHLMDLGVQLGSPARQNLFALFAKPFFFQLLSDQRIDLALIRHPNDLFRVTLGHLTKDAPDRFGTEQAIMKTLGLIAYDALDEGEEAFPVVTSAMVIRAQLRNADFTDPTNLDLVNWLIGKQMFVPLPGARICFFHQSVTEYLAAGELAERYKANPFVLREKLRLRRWDQALFLTLGFLSPTHAQRFLETVTEVDFGLAVSAVSFLEFGHENIVEQLLRAAITHCTIRSRFTFTHALESWLPITQYNGEALKNLVEIGGMFGGAAAGRLLEFCDDKEKDEIFELLVERSEDYNFCTSFSRAATAISEGDVARLVILADRLEQRAAANEKLDYVGFVAAAGSMLQEFEPRFVHEAFFDEKKPLSEQRVRCSALCHFLIDSGSSEALGVAGDLLLAGVVEAVFCIHMILAADLPASESISTFTDQHISALLAVLQTDEVGWLNDEDNRPWAVNALRSLCAARPGFSLQVRIAALEARCVLRAALLFVLPGQTHEAVFDALQLLLVMPSDEISAEPLGLLSHLRLNWKGNEGLFLKLLRLRHTRLAWKLVETAMGFRLESLTIGTLEIGDIRWWLEWLFEEKDERDGFWLSDRLSRLFARATSRRVRDDLLAEFNSSESHYRDLLARHILSTLHDLSTDDFSEDAISYLLADLAKGHYDDWRGHLFGKTATEAFVAQRLLPLLQNAEKPFQESLKNVLREAGLRHGRRYVPA